MDGSRLSPLDAAFLAVESPTAHMHVGWAAVLEPPEEEPRPNFEDLLSHIAARLPRAPRYRQLLRTVPLELHTPVWVDDGDFDVSRHVFEAGSDRLGEVVDECMSEPLPRDRPLWQIHVVPRLEDGRIGIVGKAHHCMVDGLAAVELASLLFDPEPEPPEPEPDGWLARPAPGGARLLLDGAVDFARREAGLARLPAALVRSPERAAELARRGRQALGALAEATRPAARGSSLHAPISSLRHLGFVKRPIDELLGVKRAFGVTLNDVVLAVSSGAMRRLARERDLAPQPLKTMVPVNLRPSEDRGSFGNRISFMFVDLPCDEPSPTRRLRTIHAQTSERKLSGQADGLDAVVRALSFAPQWVGRGVARLLASPRTFNLVVSNIPGPRVPLYMRGCELREGYPVVPIASRHALSIGFTTVSDGAFFGIYADPESLSETNALTAGIERELDALLARAGMRHRRFDPAPEGLTELLGSWHPGLPGTAAPL